jgi:hypothetical protein
MLLFGIRQSKIAHTTEAATFVRTNGAGLVIKRYAASLQAAFVG